MSFLRMDRCYPSSIRDYIIRHVRVDSKYATLLRVWSYASVMLASSAMNNLFVTYHIDLFTQYVRVHPSWFFYGHIIFMIWNSLNDAFFGWLSDTLPIDGLRLCCVRRSPDASRRGGGSIPITEGAILRRSRVIHTGGILWAISFALVWWPWALQSDGGDTHAASMLASSPWDVSAIVSGLHFIASLCTYDGFLTLVEVNHSSILAEMTTSSSERSLANMLAGVAAAFGSGTSILAYLVYDRNDLALFRILTVGVAIGSILAFQFAAWGLTYKDVGATSASSGRDSATQGERPHDILSQLPASLGISSPSPSLAAFSSSLPAAKVPAQQQSWLQRAFSGIVGILYILVGYERGSFEDIADREQKNSTASKNSSSSTSSSSNAFDYSGLATVSVDVTIRSENEDYYSFHNLSAATASPPSLSQPLALVKKTEADVAPTLPFASTSNTAALHHRNVSSPSSASSVELTPSIREHGDATSASVSSPSSSFSSSSFSPSFSSDASVTTTTHHSNSATISHSHSSAGNNVPTKGIAAYCSSLTAAPRCSPGAAYCPSLTATPRCSFGLIQQRGRQCSFQARIYMNFLRQVFSSRSVVAFMFMSLLQTFDCTFEKNFFVPFMDVLTSKEAVLSSSQSDFWQGGLFNDLQFRPGSSGPASFLPAGQIIDHDHSSPHEHTHAPPTSVSGIFLHPVMHRSQAIAEASAIRSSMLLATAAYNSSYPTLIEGRRDSAPPSSLLRSRRLLAFEPRKIQVPQDAIRGSAPQARFPTTAIDMSSLLPPSPSSDAAGKVPSEVAVYLPTIFDVTPAFRAFAIFLSFLLPHTLTVVWTPLIQKRGLHFTLQLIFGIRLSLLGMTALVGRSAPLSVIVAMLGNRILSESVCRLFPLVLTDLMDEDRVLYSRPTLLSASLVGAISSISKLGQSLAPLLVFSSLSGQYHQHSATGSSAGGGGEGVSGFDVSLSDLMWLLLLVVPTMCVGLQLILWSSCYSLRGQYLAKLKTRLISSTAGN